MLPKGFTFGGAVGEQYEWWANDGESILGLVAKEKMQRGWMCAVFVRKVGGTFGLYHLRLGVDSRKTAREQLLETMGLAEMPEGGIRDEGSLGAGGSRQSAG